MDNNSLEDRVVKCGNEWRIGLSGVGITDLRIIQMDDDPLSLPPVINQGGIKYQDIKAILEDYGLWEEYQEKNPFTPYTIQCIRYWGLTPDKCLRK